MAKCRLGTHETEADVCRFEPLVEDLGRGEVVSARPIVDERHDDLTVLVGHNVGELGVTNDRVVSANHDQVTHQSLTQWRNLTIEPCEWIHGLAAKVVDARVRVFGEILPRMIRLAVIDGPLENPHGRPR